MGFMVLNPACEHPLKAALVQGGFFIFQSAGLRQPTSIAIHSL
jgi:hypothetical protein